MATAIDLRRTGGMPVAGTYIFKVIRTSEEEGPKGPYYRFICQIQDGPDAGKEAMLQIGTGSNVRWKMEEFLDAIQAPTSGTWTPDRAVNKLFRATIEIQPDKSNPSIKRVGFSSMTPYTGQINFTIPDRPTLEIDEEGEEGDDDIPFKGNGSESDSDEEDIF